ncbi:MAG TPA: sigma 54-interacting transcriptional regulator [Polyangiaceae bacterium]|nr:sigma 54-interacting transcriptional regulator [Polyangiaceae bacterium]
MSDPSLHQETIDFSLSTMGSAEGALVGLTVLFHPNVERVGQVSALFSLAVGGVRRLSRLEPEFHWHGADSGEPLASPVLSRTPIIVRGTEQGSLSIENPAGLNAVLVQGQPLLGAREFPESALTSGIVISLSGSVLLLLHWLSADRDPSPDLGIFGESLEIRRVREEIRRVADLDACVLIRGESGSGKELVAGAIHRHSQRKSEPYITVNMGAIPTSVGASMLFGHARGAFTGAANPSPGFFGSADRGTLFLDEVGETPRDLQALLLRAIREGEIQPVGEPRTKHVDVRVISATDADLNAMVDRGQFAMPLLRRLEGYTIAIPPLRERRDDLARLFFRFLSAELTETGERYKLDEPAPSQKPWLPASVVASLLDYDWPGNVAELETIAKRIAITNRQRKGFYLDPMIAERLTRVRTPGATEPPRADALAATIQPVTQPGLSSSHSPSGAGALAQPTVSPPARNKDAASLEDAEIAQAMREHRFKIKAAAIALGVSRSWLNTRLESCQGIRKAKELSRDEILQASSAAGGELSAMAERLEVSEHGLKLRMKALELGEIVRGAALGEE